MKFLHWLDKKFSTIENYVLVILLVAMVFLAFLEVILRNIFHTAIPDSDRFLQHLVLLIAFIGAAQAAHQKKHINVDALSKLMNDSAKTIASIFINAFSLVVIFFLARASWSFVMGEKEFGGTEIFGIQPWIYELVIPVGFFLIGYRFFLHFLDALIKSVRRRPS